MQALKIFKIYLIFYFLFPSTALYFALLTGIKIPMWIELLPLLLLLIFRNQFIGFKFTDLIFLILIVNSIIFITINSGDYSWINNIEIRSFIILGINYFIFRNIVNVAWMDQIANLIIKIIKFSMYLIVFEFIIININGISEIMETRYLAIYQERARLYEFTLFGVKSIGIYPGTHNASIAATIAILYLIITNSLVDNKKFFIVSVLAFIVSFSLTALIVLLLVFAIFKLNSHKLRHSLYKSLLHVLALSGSAFLIFVYGDFISQIKAFGEIVYLYEKTESNVYINSIVKSIESIYQYPLGNPLKQIDLFENEVYISRLLIYFGFPIIFFFTSIFIMVVKYLNEDNNYKIFFMISYLCLFISSFHYGSINYYPLNILTPLLFVFIHFRKGHVT